MRVIFWFLIIAYGPIVAGGVIAFLMALLGAIRIGVEMLRTGETFESVVERLWSDRDVPGA